MLYIDEYKFEYNPKVVKPPKIEYISDRIHDIIGNATVVNMVTVNKLRVYASVNIQENEHDHQFRRELFKIVVDCEKFFNGVYATPIVKYAIDLILKSAQFEPKLPFKPVSCFFTQKIKLSYNFIQGCLPICELHAWGSAISNESDKFQRRLQYAI